MVSIFTLPIGLWATVPGAVKNCSRRLRLLATSPGDDSIARLGSLVGAGQPGDWDGVRGWGIQVGEGARQTGWRWREEAEARVKAKARASTKVNELKEWSDEGQKDKSRINPQKVWEEKVMCQEKWGRNKGWIKVENSWEQKLSRKNMQWKEEETMERQRRLERKERGHGSLSEEQEENPGKPRWVPGTGSHTNPPDPHWSLVGYQLPWTSWKANQRAGLSSLEGCVSKAQHWGMVLWTLIAFSPLLCKDLNGK